MNRFAKIGAAGALVAGVMSQAHAALSTEVTTAISGAQTDLLALYAALTTAGAALFVGRLIYKRFTVK